MILAGPLSPERQAASRSNYNKFNFINGFSYMCLGETVIILFAVRINCPDALVAALGAMMYFGFLLLPLGKIVTARVGAAQSQATFWVLRNMAALLVASTSLLVYFGFQRTAMGILLLGAFLFYGFRAAGVVMSQPLLGEISTGENRAKFIGFSTGAFYFSALLSLVMISFLVRLSQSLWMLTGIIILGSALGVTSSRFIRRIDETENIRRSARRPILSELRVVFRNPRFRCQLLASFVINLAIIMITPMSMLTLKRGCGVSDTRALMFSLVQFGSAIIMSQCAGKIAARVGPRRVVIAAYCTLLSAAVLWVCCPAGVSAWYWALPFFLAGGAGVSIGNSMTHYFLQTVPQENRVAASLFLAVVTGAGAGVAGMLLAGGLVRLAGSWVGAEADAFSGYRLYFVLVLVLMGPALYAVTRLKR